MLRLKKKKKSINNKLFKEYYINCQSPSDMYKKLHDAKGEWNEKWVVLIREVLNKMTKTIENVPENRKFMIEENAKINTAERIFTLIS